MPLTATFMPYNSWEYYFYDPASNIQWIEEYNNGTGSGNNTGKYLNYSYHADEQRVTMGGTLASVTLPGNMTASYGTGNQLLKYNSSTQNVFYDQNGNMTNDPSLGSSGIGKLTYDARNQLISASMGPVGGPYTNVYNFSYDDLGRRLTQGVTGGNTETYVYDGGNIAFTTTSGSGIFSPFALFRGLGLDDFFSIAISGNTLGSGAQAVLHDSLGSTTATETSGGTISGTYQYGPFGSTSVGTG